MDKGKGKVSFEELIDVETLQRIGESFKMNSGIELFIAREGDERDYDYEEKLVIEGQVLGVLRAKSSTEDKERVKSVLKNEVTILTGIVYHNFKLRKMKDEYEKAAALKADFLANMSHEIRTPMNAVIGMAEMALREDLPPVAREYISQIKTAGKSLLTIINDILDFSKIESGKLDIIYSEYNIISLVNDVSGIILTKIEDKDVEFIVDVNPNFPKVLMGDDIRFKQILINLLGNAAKFTKQGQVVLSLDFLKKNESQIIIEGYVADTGIGIKQEDIGGLFDSFKQVDSKRNRNIEGTGLGLAITKNLLELMYGDILVESVYGVGTKFAFTLPQRVVSFDPCVHVSDIKKIRVASLMSNEYARRHMEKEIIRLGAVYYELNNDEMLEKIVEQKIDFVFVENTLFSDRFKKLAEENEQITIVLVVDFPDSVEIEGDNIVVVRKPVYSAIIGAILRKEPVYMLDREETAFDADFYAPDAKVLLVDDNEINLTVEEGLLEPFKMKIDTALSGREAIEKISSEKYDMIFMDHMMPEMDGVEATKIIRETHPEYNMVPIIALTANVVEETRSMFLAEGMNDFVAKPIDMKLMAGVIKRWLPMEKKKPVTNININARKQKGREKAPEKIVIGDFETANAVNRLGSEKLFWKVLKDYYNSIDRKASLIWKLYEEENWKDYTIEVHALKSTSKQVGALKLSEIAAEMEKAGNEHNIDLIKKETKSMLELYQGYIKVLRPYFEEEAVQTEDKEQLPVELQRVYVESLAMAATELDFDTFEATIAEIEKYSLQEDVADCFKELKEAFDAIDFQECSRVLERWKSYIMQNS